MPLHTLTNAQFAKAVSQAKIEAEATGQLRKIADGGGLMLIVRPTGGCSWVLRVMRDSVRKDITIGQHPPVSLSQAREKSAEFREKSPARKATVFAGDGQDTIKSLMLDWLKSGSRSEVYRGNIERAMELDVLPAIGAMHPAKVTGKDINDILRKIEARDSLQVLRNVRMWLRHMFEYGIDDERRPSLVVSPVRQGNMASFKKAERGHFAAITNPNDIPSLMRGIRATSSHVVRTAMLFSAYTFQRPSEIREMTWPEVDLDQAVWMIPAERMKLRREHWVPLAPQVVKLLREFKERHTSAYEWVFLGRSLKQPMSEGALLQRLIDLGYQGLHTPHGFRAMARTILEERLGVDAKFIEKQLSHETATHGGAYNRAQYLEERTAMMVKWADWLDQQG
jgi:integrase